MFALCVGNLFVNLSQCCVYIRFNPYSCLSFAYKHNWLCIRLLNKSLSQSNYWNGHFLLYTMLMEQKQKTQLTVLVSLNQEVMTQEQFFICQIWSI